MSHQPIGSYKHDEVGAYARPSRTATRFLRDNVLIAALYWSVSQLNMVFFSNYGVLPMPIWPAASIAVAVGFMLGWRGAPGLVVGTILANALALGSSWPVATGVSVMNTIGPLFGTWLIKRYATRFPPFGCVRDAGLFLVCGVVLIPLLTATGGITSTLAGGRIGWDAAPLSWLRWWVAHASGTLLFAPLLLCWWADHKSLPVRSSLEFLGTSLALLIVTALIFFLIDGVKIAISGIAYVLIIPLVWVAVRFETREAMTLLPLMIVVALAATVMGYGPFLGRQLPLVSVGVMVVIFGLTMLLLGALAATRRQVEEEHGKLVSIVHHAADLINLATLDGQMIFLNKAGGAMLGIEPAEAARHHILDVIPKEAKHLAETELLPALREGGAWEGDLRYQNLKTGELTDVHAVTFSIKDPVSGAPLYLANVSRDITDRKQAEEEMSRLTAILESTNDLVALAAPDGRLSYLNAAGRRILGLGEREDLGEYTIQNAHRPRTYDLIKNEVIPAALAKGIWQGETVLLSRDGREIPCSQTIMVHRSANGEVRYLSFIMRDISERKQAEEEVRLNEQRFEALFSLNQMSDATLDGLCQFAMEEAVRLTKSTIGYIAFANEDETILTMHAWSKTAMRECAIQDKPMVYQVEATGLWGEAIRQRRPIITNDYAGPNPWKKGYPEGHVHVARHMNAPIFDGDRIVIVAGVGNKPTDYDDTDVRQLTLLMQGMWGIVQRKRAEEVLRRSEETYRGIFDASNEAMFVHDATGAFVDVNRRMCELYGVSREEALRLQIADFSSGEPPYSQVEAVEWVKKAYEKGPQLFEWRCRRRNGELFWGEVALSRSRIGGRERVIAAVRDVTERRNLEDQLRQAQKMEAVGQLAGGVAHDFNNLLQAINGYTDLALQEIEPAHAARPLLEEVLKAGDRAATLVRQLLAFSRQQVIRPEYLDLNEAVAGLLKMLVRVLGEHIRINFVPGHSPGTVHADRGQIEQVLMNLSVNARDAMPQGGTITIETAQTQFDDEYCRIHTWAKPGLFVVLSVTDTGCGMDAQTLTHIFDPFFTTKEVGKGTGLGLATVYGIVKQHNGMITVYSEPGHGTVFKVYLPRVNPSSEEVSILKKSLPRNPRFWCWQRSGSPFLAM